MFRQMILCILLWGLGSLDQTQASVIHRCTDAHGHSTFTQQPCPSGQQQSTQHLQFNTPLQSLPIEQQRTRAKPGLKVVGVDQGITNGCGDLLNSQQRRTAVVRKQVRPGMTQADIESALGKPQRITRNNGNTTFHYRDRDGNTRTVRFKDGCVKP